MSGPIVRKYGFANFEKIFGERPLEHGVDETEATDEPVEKPESAKTAKPAPAKKKSTRTKKS